LLGLWVKVKTTAGEDIEGRVYAYDTLTNCVALEIPRRPVATPAAAPAPSVLTQANPPRYDFRIFKINYLREVIPLPDESPAPATNGMNGAAAIAGGVGLEANIFSTAMPPINHVHVERLQVREQLAIKEMGAQLAKTGVGVTQEGQEIFDALSKTLPCRWHKDTIVVLDEVLISSPYDVDSCRASTSSSASLARVKKVLEGERKRLAIAKK